MIEMGLLSKTVFLHKNGNGYGDWGGLQKQETITHSYFQIINPLQ